MDEDWPPFRATVRETRVPEDDSSAGTVESWEITYRNQGDWTMTALAGDTTGNDTLPDGTRFTENVEPATTVTMNSKGLIYKFPDGTSTTVSDELSAPNYWLQPRYGSSIWSHAAAGDETTVLTQSRARPCEEASLPASADAGCTEIIRVEVNRHGVPTEYTETVDGQPTFSATVLEFELLDE